MELLLSGNALRTLHRSITCLARVGTELVLQASPSRLALHTLNASRSAYLSLSFNPDFFDAFSLLSSPTVAAAAAAAAAEIQCSVLLKSVCSVLRTPVSALDRLSLLLPSPDAAKIQWTLHCLNGARKTYWISCNAEPDVQHLSLDRSRFPSSLAVRPRDLARLLANFQSSLQEITIIATEPASVPPDAGAEIGGKSVELRSYIDHTKDNSDESLHTQLWIDTAEEFLQYTHVGDPVDVTFGVKELKAFLSFCEGCEVDIHLFFEKAGEPILMAPRFGLDDGSTLDIDATLVLATMLVSQLNEGTTTNHQPVSAAQPDQDVCGRGSELQGARGASVSEHPSDHTKIWSELSGSVGKSSDATRERQVQMEGNPSSSVQNGMQRPNITNASMTLPARENAPDILQLMETDPLDEPQDRGEVNGNPYSQNHPSNWVGEDADDDDGNEDDLYVQPTPDHYERQ